MRIAIDVRALLDRSPSGISIYTTEIISSMLRIAPHHEYHLFYTSWSRVILPFTHTSVRIHGIKYPNKLVSISQWALSRPYWDHLVSADCIFAPSLRLLPVSSQTPVVTTVHDLSFEYFPEFLSWRRRLWHVMMQPEKMCQVSSHIIAVSQATARDVQELYGIPEWKISVIYSGVSAALRGVTENRHVLLRRKYQLTFPFILSVGTREPRKNIPSLLSAFEQIADRVPHHLVIVGPEGWRMRGITHFMQKTEVADRIHFLGIISDNDKMALYAAADLFVYPSFYEGFGFPPLEALVVGTPVITSYNSALPEVVGKWATLIDPAHPAELALAMEERLTHPSRVPEAVQTAVQNTYSWERAARQTLTILEQFS